MTKKDKENFIAYFKCKNYTFNNLTDSAVEINHNNETIIIKWNDNGDCINSLTNKIYEKPEDVIEDLSKMKQEKEDYINGID